MFLFFPFAVKNPPRLFPWVTLSLIALNTLIYALTTDYFLFIRESILDRFATEPQSFDIVRMLASMFLHAEPMHLLGNMWFLWIFGPAVEGRLGHLRYAGFYLLVGCLSELAQGIFAGGIGASGAIMGIAGAYVYLFPFARIQVCYMYTFWFIRAGVASIQAQWVVLFFVGLDIFHALIYMGHDGVGHVAHLSGFAAGFLILMALRLRRDSEDVAEAQAMRSDSGGNLLSLNLAELESLMDANPDDPRFVVAFVQKSATHYNAASRKLAADALSRHGMALIEAGNCETLAEAILGNEPILTETPSPFLFRLGGKLESERAFPLAMRCYYQIIVRIGMVNVPAPAEAEMSLARLARLTEQELHQNDEAAAIWIELLRLFPHSPQAPNAEAAIRRLGRPEIVFSAGVQSAGHSAPIVPDGLGIVTSPAMLAAAKVSASTADGANSEPAATLSDSGLAPIAPGQTWIGGGARASAEASYRASDVSGMSLAPIGGYAATPADGTPGGER